MAHDHHHHEDDSYYLDQLCLVALSAAFAGICLTMSLWQTSMLNLILAPQFHPFVLGSGIALVILVLLRAAVLWQLAGKPAPATTAGSKHAHEHHHHEQHEHKHGETCEQHHHGDHDHHHGQGEHCEHHHHGDHEHHHHGHGHAQHHHHGHSHSHAHDDHEHGWAPWRYVVVLIPVMIFLLGLPSRGPMVSAAGIPQVDMTQEAVENAALVALGSEPLPLLCLAATTRLDQGQQGPAKGVDFKTLEAAALQATDRDYWQGKTVQVLGQFAPSSRSDQIFSLVRFRIQCCAADAIQLNVPIISRESVTGIAPNDWVKVTGRVEFREQGGKYFTLLLVNKRSDIVPSPPDPQQYIQ